MDEHKLFGAFTYIHVALSGTKLVGRWLVLSRDRSSTVAVGRRRPRFVEKKKNDMLRRPPKNQEAKNGRDGTKKSS